jgi:hypothetical protein
MHAIIYALSKYCAHAKSRGLSLATAYLRHTQPIWAQLQIEGVG